jgi:hypothetical protein
MPGSSIAYKDKIQPPHLQANFALPIFTYSGIILLTPEVPIAHRSLIHHRFMSIPSLIQNPLTASSALLIFAGYLQIRGGVDKFPAIFPTNLANARIINQ